MIASNIEILYHERMGRRPIYYDTETTGVKPMKDCIIEIAAYDPVRDKTFCSFVNPQIPIPAEASAVCNITDDMVKDAPIFRDVGQAFIDFCDGDVVLIAHNNDNFDRLFLENECNRHALSYPNFVYIDTLKWARRYRPDLPRHPLQYLREIYNVTQNQAHRALDDVYVLHQIFTQMIDDLSMEEVLALLYAPRASVRKMSFGKHKGEPLEKVPKHYLRWLKDSGALDKPENIDLKASLELLSLV